jgi:hypothetical protein
VPGGLIHDWIGAIFVPQTSLESVVAVAHDYEHYWEFYRPTVVDSKLLDCAEGQQRFSMMWVHRVLFVTTALENRYEALDFPAGTGRWYTATASTRVREVENYGTPDRHLLSRPGKRIHLGPVQHHQV